MAESPTEARPFAAKAPGIDDVVTVNDLSVHFFTSLGVVRALNGVSFSIPRGKTLGVVGESGCGKSITGLSIMQLVPRPGRVMGGEVLFRPKETSAPIDVLKYERNGSDMRHIRGRDIGMIFQEPMTSLNPCYTVGNQIIEPIALHRNVDKDAARGMAVDILRRVGMPNPERIMNTFPHQLSGGMRQRAMIAMALSCTPELLIADEPTTALDVTTEAQILDLMRDLQQEIGMSIMFVTHNLGVVAQLCDEVAVMYLGKVVERATVDEIFYDPKHPYTISLLRSIPRLGTRRKEPLEVIRGSIPDPYTTVTGCPFHPRCPSFMPGKCDVLVPGDAAVAGAPAHSVRCLLYEGSSATATTGSSGGMVTVTRASA